MAKRINNKKSNKIEIIGKCTTSDVIYTYRNYMTYVIENDYRKAFAQSKRTFVCEYIQPGKPVNLKIDFDYETASNTDKDKMQFYGTVKKVITSVRKAIECEGYSYNMRSIYLYESPMKVIDNKYGYSMHIVFRGENFCFNSKADLKAFAQKYNIEGIDLSVYGDGLFRCPYSSKLYQNRRAIPLHTDAYAEFNKMSELDKFKMGLMGFVEDKQKQNIIRLVTDDIILEHCICKPVERVLNENCQSNEVLLFNRLFGINIYKKYHCNGFLYYYYDDISCLLCKCKHDRSDGKYIIVYSDTYNLINIALKCWNNESGSFFKLYVSRNNVYKIKDIKGTEITKYDIVLLHDIVKYLGFDIINDMKFTFKENILNERKHVVCEKYLRTENFEDKPTIFISSVEGTGKSYSLVTYNINKINEDVNTKIIVCSPNRATLNNIYNEFVKHNFTPSYYKDLKYNEICDGEFKILIITINSLYKLISNCRIFDIQNYIFWNDETNKTIEYINSPTLKNRRLMSYSAFEMLVRASKQCIFTCADLTDDVIDMINMERNRDYQIIVNTFRKTPLEFNILFNDTYTFTKNIAGDLNNNDNVAVLLDSKNNSKALDLVIVKKYVEPLVQIDVNEFDKIKQGHNNCIDNLIKNNQDITMYIQNLGLNDRDASDKRNPYDDLLLIEIIDNLPDEHKSSYKNKLFNLFDKLYPEIMLINSEINNDVETFRNINDIIKNRNVRILMASPSLSIGVSIDITNHFHRIYGWFTSRSLSARGCQQQLNRIRNPIRDNHFILLDGIFKRDTMSDSDLYEKILAGTLNNRNNIIQELAIKPNFDINGNGQLITKSNDFLTKIYIKMMTDKVSSDKDFVNSLLIEIARRGNKINIISILEKKDSNLNKETKKIIRTHVEDIKLAQVREIIGATLVNCDEYSMLLDKQIEGATNNDENLRILKYKIFNWYSIKNDISNNVAVQFVTEIKADKLKRKINNWAKFILFPNNKKVNIDDIPIHDSINIQKHDIIIQLIKDIGFTNGIVSNDVLNNIDHFSISKDIINKLQGLFKEDNNVGQLRSNKRDSHRFILYLSRLLYDMYGVRIRFYEKKNRINDDQLREKSKYRLVIDPVMKDYLVINFYKNIDKLNISREDTFNFSHIHGFNGTYDEFISRNNEFTDLDYLPADHNVQS